MTQDLRQAILALTNATKAIARGEIPATDLNKSTDLVLSLMPAGPILETLWAGLPVPVATMSAKEGEDYEVRAYYRDRESADNVHVILTKPMVDHAEMLRQMAASAEAASQKARLEREHALEKRLLDERTAFDATAPDNPLRVEMRRQLESMAYSSYVDVGEVDASIDEAMARLAEVSTKPLHVPAETS